MEEAHESALFQFFVCASATSLPMSFVKHCWIVALRPHEPFARFDVFTKKDLHPDAGQSIGYWYKNALPPFQGMPLLYQNYALGQYTAQILHHLEGGRNSLAARFVEAAYESERSYPYHHYYRLWPGPNSNTFVSWVLHQVPEGTLPLPFCAFGKNYSLE